MKRQSVPLQHDPMPFPLLILLVSCCLGVWSLLSGCTLSAEPDDRYRPYRARLLPASASRPGPQEKRALETKQEPPRQCPQEAPEVRQRRRCLPLGPWVGPPRTYAPQVVEPGPPYDYERAIDAQEQAYRQQRRVQELEQEQREQQWEAERRWQSDPRRER